MYLNVNNIFRSVEGEGKEVGTPTVFVRLSGCDFKCPFCDTKESWLNGEIVESSEVAQKVEKQLDATHVSRLSITGGNPFLQPRGMLSLMNEFVKRMTTGNKQFLRIDTINFEHPGFMVTDHEGMKLSPLSRDSVFFMRVVQKFKNLNVRITTNMDIKYPLIKTEWCDSRKFTSLHLRAASFLRKLGVEVTLKALIESEEDVELWLSGMKIFKNFDLDGVTNTVSFIRKNPKKIGINKSIRDEVVDNAITHGWKINPNLHVTLGID